MADTKISALTDGTTADATDRLPVARSPFASGDNRYVTPAYIGTYLAKNTLAAGTITTDQPMSITQTWNAGGVAFTAFKVNATSTASAGGSLLLDLQLGGTSFFSVRKDGYTLIGQGLSLNGTSMIIGSNAAVIGMGASNDVLLYWDAANTLALRNSTNAQAFRVYNTYTDGSNYEYGVAGFVGSRFQIGAPSTGKAGTGVHRALDLFGSSITVKCLDGATSDVWYFLTTGIFCPAVDATYDVGRSTGRVLSAWVSKSLQGAGTTKTLTESAATGLCDIALASGARTGGVLHYTIEADDGTDFQTRTGMAYFTAVNKAGAITTGIQVVGTEGVAVSAGTLTVTITNATGASKITLQANAVSSLTQTTLRCKWFVQTHDTAAITAL